MTYGILLLEDDDAERELLKSELEAAFPGQIEGWTASDVATAEQLLLEQADAIDIVIADVRMADGTTGGLTFARRATQRLPVIVISAHPPAEYADEAANMGPAVFLRKGRRLVTELIAELRNVLAWCEAEKRQQLEQREFRSLSLARRPGVIVAVHFHLQDIPVEALIDPRATTFDFAALAVGYRQLEEAVQRNQGQIVEFGGQTAIASFAFDEDEGGDEAFRGAVTSLLMTRQGVGDDAGTVFYRCPFSAAVVPGLLVSGMFGKGVPGRGAIVGRPGKAARQMAMRGAASDIAVEKAWLTDKQYDAFDRISGTVREEACMLDGFTGMTNITFKKPSEL